MIYVKVASLKSYLPDDIGLIKKENLKTQVMIILISKCQIINIKIKEYIFFLF